jgi:CheY-like chemotaxis protein
MTGNLYLAQKLTTSIPRVQSKLNNIKDLSFRAADLIQQLLTFARKDMIHIQPLSLVPFFKDIIKFSHSIIPENITIHHAIDVNSLYIKGDTTQLHQVLINLLTNARDAVEGVERPRIIMSLDTFKTDDAFIDQHPYFKPGLYARLSVQDNGHGISKKDIEHIFEPFFTTKEQGKGTGLGLSMVFGAVKNHHGFIEIDSIEGKGSTFHIYIPRLMDNEHVAPPVLLEKQVTEGHGELILLVDDEKDVREIGKDVLETLGYKILEASDGLEAVKVFTEHQDEISLIIMDVVMPRLGGVKAIERIRTIQPNISVIFATGYDKEATFPDKIPTSGEFILSKPYDIQELSHVIRRKLKV